METLGEIWGWKKKIGIALFVLSFALYGLLLIMPLVSLSLEVKATLSVMIVISAEGSFWLSVIILGREAIDKYRKIDLRARISRWMNRKDADQQIEDASLADPDGQTDANRQI